MFFYKFFYNPRKFFLPFHPQPVPSVYPPQPIHLSLSTSAYLSRTSSTSSPSISTCLSTSSPSTSIPSIRNAASTSTRNCLSSSSPS